MRFSNSHRDGLSSLILALLISTVLAAPTTPPLAPPPPTASSASPSTIIPPKISLTGAPEPLPQITTPPSIEAFTEKFGEKYHMTTYWSCVTIATDVHCGWHEPVLAGGDEIARAGRREMSPVGLVVGVVGIAFGVLMR